MMLFFVLFTDDAPVGSLRFFGFLLMILATLINVGNDLTTVYPLSVAQELFSQRLWGPFVLPRLAPALTLPGSLSLARSLLLPFFAFG